MKKNFLILFFLIFTISYSYCDIDFRNNNTVMYKSYEETVNNSETIIKLSLGIHNDINSKINCQWDKYITYYEYNYNYWQYIGYDWDYGKKEISNTNNDITYDLALEYRYYFYDFFAFGGGINLPLKKIEAVGNIEVYTLNPYLSFKLKNFSDDMKVLDNFYILLNLGTVVPLGHLKSIDNLKLGFDIGAGYEYKHFIFELTYSKYSVDLSDFYYSKYDYYERQTDSTHKYYYSYEEYVNANNVNVDITRIKFSVGYKF